MDFPVTGVNCPAGRFGNITGLRQEKECSLCSPGMYCPTPGLVMPYAECEAGYYCELGATRPNAANETWGYLCPAGHYCPQGTPVPLPCGKGTYQPVEGMYR